jgi:hypothetical protein
MERTMRRACAAFLGLILCSATAWGQAPSPWPSLSDNLATHPPNPLDAALLIAVEDYAFAPDVPGAAKNVDDWYAWLRKAQGLPLDKIVLLKDGDATREGILEALASAKNKVAQGGTLWVVFVGHGAPSKDGSDGLLLGVDVQQTSKSLEARGVKQQELLRALAGDPQGQTLLVLDACFSGLDRSGNPLAPGLQPFLPAQPAALPDKLLLLTAARQDQVAGPLPGGDRPAFSYLLLGALRGWADQNRDDTVTAQEALDYTREVLGAMAQDRLQTPQLFGDPAAVLSQGQQAPGPDLDALRLRLQAPAALSLVPPTGLLLRVEAMQEDRAYQVRLLDPQGQERACPQDVSALDPCTLQALAPGTFRVDVRGAVRVTESLSLDGPSVVEIHDVPGWALWTGLGTLFVGEVLLLTGLMSESCSPSDPSLCDATTYGIVAPIVGGLGMGAGMGLMGWWLWEAWGTWTDGVELRPLTPPPSP